MDQVFRDELFRVLSSNRRGTRVIPVAMPTKVEFKVSGEGSGTPYRYTSIHVDAVIEGNAPDEELQKLLELAERVCAISNTVKEGAPISLTRHASLEAAVAD